MKEKYRRACDRPRVSDVENESGPHVAGDAVGPHRTPFQGHHTYRSPRGGRPPDAPFRGSCPNPASAGPMTSPAWGRRRVWSSRATRFDRTGWAEVGVSGPGNVRRRLAHKVGRLEWC